MPQSQIEGKGGNLEALAKAHFNREFSEAERNLLASAPEGQWAYCNRQSKDSNHPSNDPGKAEKSRDNPGWKRYREIDAELIRWLCVDRKAREQVDPLGLQIHGAKITGGLNLSFVMVPFPIGLWRCALVENAQLESAEIPGLLLTGSWTRNIAGDRVVVKGEVALNDGFRANGGVGLLSAQIGGDLDCEGGTFNNPSNNPNDYALNADLATVKGGVYLRNGFHANGAVGLEEAQIDGNLECDGGAFNNPHNSPDDYALSANLAMVKGGVYLGNGFYANGAVRLSRAQIGGNLDCDGGTFSNSGGDALIAEDAAITGHILLEGFTANGAVKLSGVHIQGNLDYWGANLSDATLYLKGASAYGILDDSQYWPKKSKLFLDGFKYEQIVDGPKNAATRLDWLARQPDEPFATQPYLQLAKVLRAAGDDPGAERVLMNMEDRRRAGNWLRLPLKWTVGYGYRPRLAVWEILGLSGLGWILYRRAYLAGRIVPTEKEASEKFKHNGQIPSHYQAFSPLVYSLENSLPVVKLGQGDKWQPDPARYASPRTEGWLKNARREKAWPRAFRFLERLLTFTGLLAPMNTDEPPSRLSRYLTGPRFLREFLWLQILLGWVLASFLVLGLAGLIHKE
jgi:hypothetical protein